jgi:hypothetical protein
MSASNLSTVLVILLSSAFLNLSATDIGGTVTSDITLGLAGSPYNLTEDYIVPDGFTLTIEAGVEIQLSLYDRDIIIAGSLIAQGTANDSIFFHSDATLGGGTVKLLTSSNSHSLSYCDFKRLGTFGGSAFETGLYLEDTTLEMDHCSFIECGPSGMRHMVAHASAVSEIGPSNSIDIVEFIDNSLVRSCSWPNIDSDGFSYVLVSDQTNSVGHTLSIEPGVTIELSTQDMDLLNEGSLLAIGSIAGAIQITSNGSLGGGSLALLANSTSILEYVEFSFLGTFGGSTYDTGLYLEDASLTMDQCAFSNCGTGGVRHMRADANALSNIGPGNSIDRIRLLPNTLNFSATWPNMDMDGCIIEYQGDQILGAGNQLIIEPGVEIDLLDQNSDLIISGTLIAMGLESAPIHIFSSGALRGGSIALLDNSVAQLNYLNIDSLGTFSGSAYDTGLYIEHSSVTADHLSFANCGLAGVRHIVAHQDVLSDFGPNNELLDVVIVDAAQDQDATWPILDSNGFRYVLEADVIVDQNISLTIDAGAKVHFNQQSVDLIVNGSLSAMGTAEDSIRFYSTYTLGGGSLAFGSSSSSNSLQYCAINDLGRFGGSAYDAGVYTETGGLEIEKCTIRNSSRGISILSGQPDIQNNIIKDNNAYGLFNTPANSDVTACDNYWGDPSGPYNPTSNPAGLGDRVSDNVIAIGCDADPLEIVCPSDTTLYIGDVYSEVVLGIVDICIRDCGMSSSFYMDELLDPQCSGDMTRTWLVEDTCARQKQCTQIITWIDSILPLIACPPTLLLECNQTLPPVDLAEVISSDNCNQEIFETFEGEETTVFGCTHQIERSFQVADAAGNSRTCSTLYFVDIDIVEPVIQNVPADIEVICDEVPIAPILSTFDECGSPEAVFSENVEGDCPGIITRTWMATDGCANSALAVQVITVVLPPCPEDINGDGIVDIQDFIQLNSAFGSSCDDCPEDINRDGVVDITDFIQFNSAYGELCEDLVFNQYEFNATPFSYDLSAAISSNRLAGIHPELKKFFANQKNQMSLALFPVPNDGSYIGFQIQGSTPIADQTTIYQVLDMTGKLVRRGTSEFDTVLEHNHIQLGQKLEAGIYFLHLAIADVLLSKKLIVE